jgi:hypothetical protein
MTAPQADGGIVMDPIPHQQTVIKSRRPGAVLKFRAAALNMVVLQGTRLQPRENEIQKWSKSVRAQGCNTPKTYESGSVLAGTVN